MALRMQRFNACFFLLILLSREKYDTSPSHVPSVKPSLPTLPSFLFLFSLPPHYLLCSPSFFLPSRLIPCCILPLFSLLHLSTHPSPSPATIFPPLLSSSLSPSFTTTTTLPSVTARGLNTTHHSGPVTSPAYNQCRRGSGTL